MLLRRLLEDRKFKAPLASAHRFTSCRLCHIGSAVPTGVLKTDKVKVTVVPNRALPTSVSAAIHWEHCRRQVARLTEVIGRPKATLRDFPKPEVTLPSLAAQPSWTALVAAKQQAQRHAIEGIETAENLFNAFVRRALRSELSPAFGWPSSPSPCRCHRCRTTHLPYAPNGVRNG